MPLTAREGIAYIRLARLYDALGKSEEAFEAYKAHYTIRKETGVPPQLHGSVRHRHSRRVMLSWWYQMDQGEDTAEALLYMATICNEQQRWYDAEMYAGCILTLPFPVRSGHVHSVCKHAPL